MLPIYIPSLRRAGEVTRGPMPLLGALAGAPVTYAVPPAEALAYADALAGWPSAAVAECPAQGIAATRKWIGEHAAKAGHHHFMMVDDDVGFLVRRGPDNWQLRDPEPTEAAEMLQAVDQCLMAYAHVGISAREGNNRVGIGAPDNLYAENTRTLRCLAYKTDAFLRAEHGRVAVMEDFDVNLQLLRMGLPNICLYYWAQGQRMTNAPGGCSTYRTHSLHEESAKRLAELHSGFVRLRQKQNKTDRDGFGTRTEVTIAWKAAYADGQLSRAEREPAK